MGLNGFWRAVGTILILFAVVIALWIITYVSAYPRDLDGRFAQNPYKDWFNSLASGKGLCCSFADGLTIQDVDWRTKDGHYQVWINQQWIDVPDNALVHDRNRFGPAVVWPYQDVDGTTKIRCFLPGAGT
jgi:hypothetical protein